jgi:hypothetical protein
VADEGGLTHVQSDSSQNHPGGAEGHCARLDLRNRTTFIPHTRHRTVKLSPGKLPQGQSVAPLKPPGPASTTVAADVEHPDEVLPHIGGQT